MIDWQQPIAGFDPWRDPTGSTFYESTAQAVVDWFPANLKHGKGSYAGEPFRLAPWQALATGHLFGWKDASGLRRFRKCFIYVPRKNGKSCWTAGLSLLLFVADGEAGAEVYTGAADFQQAGLVYTYANLMVQQNPSLSNMIRTYRAVKSMEHDKTNSIYRVLSSDADTKHGLNPSAYIVDEVHAQKKPDLMEVLETGTGVRKQPLGIYLTTADFARPSPCNTMHDYACKVRDGIICDPSFLPVIYQASLDDDWHSESVWHAANPNFDIMNRQVFLDDYRKACNQPSFENTFKRLRLNIQTEQQDRWLRVEDWDVQPEPLRPDTLLGEPCYGGLDLSTTTDLSAFVLYFHRQRACLCWFWCPSERGRNKPEYAQWIDSGHIEETPGNVIDYRYIRQQIVTLCEQYEVQDIGYDPYNATQIATELSEEDGIEMVQFRQGFLSMNEPAKELERLVIKHELCHFGNPVLRWMASNAAVKTDPTGNIKPVKPQHGSTRKIDGIVALTMALGRAIVNIDNETEPEILFL